MNVTVPPPDIGINDQPTQERSELYINIACFSVNVIWALIVLVTLIWIPLYKFFAFRRELAKIIHQTSNDNIELGHQLRMRSGAFKIAYQAKIGKNVGCGTLTGRDLPSYFRFSTPLPFKILAIHHDAYRKLVDDLKLVDNLTWDQGISNVQRRTLMIFGSLFVLAQYVILVLLGHVNLDMPLGESGLLVVSCTFILIAISWAFNNLPLMKKLRLALTKLNSSSSVLYWTLEEFPQSIVRLH